ncbi:MAG: universal stress protein [Chloroflexota bacterium]|nr:universal stress protein [Chloroflexota bacterium]
MFDHILIPLDGSSLAECVVPHAVGMVDAFDSRLTLLSVVKDREPYPRLSLGWRYRRARATQYLEQLTRRLKEAGIYTDQQVVQGKAAASIVAYAEAQDVDLILLSSHGASGPSHWNISSVVQKVVQHAYRSMMIVRAYQLVPLDLTPVRYARLLVPLDGSQRAEQALPVAVALARHHDADLLLAHVIRPPELPQRAPSSPEDYQLAEHLTARHHQSAIRYLEQLQEQLSPTPTVHIVVNEKVSASLHDLVEAEEVDMLVASARGHSSSSRWPHGSITSNLISYATVPLLVVQDFVPEVRNI